ncbi:MAG: hypothetical protein CSA20_08015 [Deltaproteobacteria bacterium]|nr:MAG: hypothetical protein CSA20_08015 [Deltaproteobacteria bacterium]
MSCRDQLHPHGSLLPEGAEYVADDEKPMEQGVASPWNSCSVQGICCDIRHVLFLSAEVNKIINFLHKINYSSKKNIIDTFLLIIRRDPLLV